MAGNAEYLLFDTMPSFFKEKGLVKAGGRVHTDATYILAAVRVLNRAMCVGETLRAALNTLAVVVPDWLRSFAKPEWYERYSHRIEENYSQEKKLTGKASLKLWEQMVTAYF